MVANLGIASLRIVEVEFIRIWIGRIRESFRILFMFYVWRLGDLCYVWIFYVLCYVWSLGILGY